jgi:predicted secreted hydrolase
MRGVPTLLGLLLSTMAAAAGPELPAYPPVLQGEALTFPADHGAHPDYRTEWWYLTGWLETGDGAPLGFQITFFRSRPAIDERNPSTFAARQVLFAHAALSDPALGHLLHGERIARAGFGLAEAATGDTNIVLQDWRLERAADGRFVAHAGSGDFTLDLDVAPTQPVLPEGIDGYSQKGPLPTEASRYYSIPHLAVAGTVTRFGRTAKVTGEAWLDREWSSTLLDPAAVGWDWLGLDLDDGGALMAFQIRGAVRRLGPEDVRFTTERLWHSPRTGADYPVERGLDVTLPEGVRHWRLRPLFDDQELDSRAAGGPVYWEGAVRSEDGRGYLELTGYLDPLKL